MPRVDEHDYADQALARAHVRADEFAPSCAKRLRHARVAVAWEVDEQARFAEGVEVDGLRAARRLARAGERLATGQGVERARFADVRAPGQRDFRRARGRQVARPPRGAPEDRLRDGLHGEPDSNKIAPFG